MNSPSARGAGGRVPRCAWELGPSLSPLRKGRTAPPRRSKPTLKPYDPVVLRWIHRHKLVYPWLLQRQFPRWLTSAKTTHRNLERLQQLRLLKPIVIRGARRDFPNCYQVTGRGLKLVAGELEQADHAVSDHLVADTWKRRGLAGVTVQHELCTTETTVYLERLITARPDLSLCLLERRYNREGKRLTFSHNNRRRAVVPDAGLLVARPRGRPIFYALEVDLGTESGRGVWGDKLERYPRWHELAGRSYLRQLQRKYDAGPGRPEFRLVIVAHDPISRDGNDRRLAAIFAQALHLSARWRRRIWLTTGRALLEHVYDKPGVDAPIWYRVDAADRWVHEFRQFRREVQGSNRSSIKENDFVLKRLARLPRLQLLDPRT